MDEEEEGAGSLRRTELARPAALAANLASSIGIRAVLVSRAPIAVPPKRPRVWIRAKRVLE
eukprot:1052037-Heterocapsa_arctica.AAC.1